MEKSAEDSFQAAKEAESRIAKLQVEVHHVKQRIQLSESEERAEIEECEKKIKANDEQIRELGRQIQELQISKNRGLHSDERIIAKAFREHSRDIGILAGKSGREAREIMDGKVLDLIKKSNALTHELNKKERELADLKEHSKDIAWNTYNEFEAEHAESETMRRVRELENEYQKVEKNLLECQIIQAKYKAIQEQLQRELLAYPALLAELEERHREQLEDMSQLLASEERALQRREVARRELNEVEGEAIRARLEKERVIAEYSKALKPTPLDMQQKQSIEMRETEVAEHWRQLRTEQETELKSLREAFEKIKEAIGISDIKDAPSRFHSQKTRKEELTELVNKAERKWQAMKSEVAELRTKNESLRGAELASPQISLEKDLEQAKLEQEEEVKRKAAAEAELERIKKLHADIKSGLWQQLQVMEKYLREEDDVERFTESDEEVTVIVTKIEKLLMRIFEKLKDQDLEFLKDTLKKEEFSKIIEPTKLVASAGAARKLKPPEEIKVA